MIEVCNRVFLSFFLIYIVTSITSVCPLTPTTTANPLKMRRQGVDVKYPLQWFGLNHFTVVQSCFPLVPTPCRYEGCSLKYL